MLLRSLKALQLLKELVRLPIQRITRQAILKAEWGRKVVCPTQTLSTITTRSSKLK